MTSVYRASLSIILLLTTLITISPAARSADGGQWTMPGKNYSSTRYSELAEITSDNAKGLHPVWTFSTGVLGGHQGQPLVVNNTMFVVTPYPNVLYAFDLTKEGYPLKWKYRPTVSSNAIGVACCDAINRGATFADGRIIYNLLDGHTVAVDAESGEELWKTQIADMAQGETTPMAPLVIKDRVIVGASGGEFGIYGWLKGLDAKTGAIVWTGHNLGPDADMLVKPGSFKPHYDKEVENTGTKSWDGESWSSGGGPVWGWISYDPDLDLLYYGSGNPSPYNSEQRLGDNKWTASVLARRPSDGSLIWAYQFTPHDGWDYDATSALILADLPIAGQSRKVLIQFNKNGFQYTLDRATGELLSAKPYVDVNWATGVDLATGRPSVVEAKLTGASKGLIKNVCPSLEGGVSPAAPPAYSPKLGLFYTSINNLCMDFGATPSARFAGTPYIGGNTPYHVGPAGKNLGGFIAWDAVNGKRVWGTKEEFLSWSGALVTAGDVAFYGTLDGWFKSVNAKTGEVLSKFKIGSGVVGNPITYSGPDGKQYVAVYAGIGGDLSLFANDTSADATDVRPPADFMPDLARHTSHGGIVWIFGL